MEVLVTTGAIRRAKLQSNHHHQQTNTQLLIGRMPFLSPNQQCQSTGGKAMFDENCQKNLTIERNYDRMIMLNGILSEYVSNVMDSHFGIGQLGFNY